MAGRQAGTIEVRGGLVGPQPHIAKIDHRQVGAAVLKNRLVAAIGEERKRRAVFKHEGEPFGGIGGIERHIGAAGFQHRQESHHRWIAQQPELQHVQLFQREAVAFTGLPSGPFDTVVLNSVVQYFPDLDYLLAALQEANKRLAPGGRVFIGDVRHFGLIELFHASVQLAKAPGDLPLQQLRDRMSWALARDKELLIDPGFFHRLRERLPAIGSVEVLLKRGRADNELTRFRYDVILHAGERRGPLAPAERDWAGDDSMASLETWLKDQRPAALHLRGVPNRRLAREVLALDGLKRGDGRCVADLLDAVKRQPSVGEDPEAFWSLAKTHGYGAQIQRNQDPQDGRFDVLLYDPAPR
jgi:SAM-dependent methyltransferase